MASELRQAKQLCKQEVQVLEEKVQCLEEKEKMSREAKERVVGMLSAFESEAKVGLGLVIEKS